MHTQGTVTRYLSHCLQVVALAASLAAHAEPLRDGQYTWSVVPQFTGLAVHRDWTPILRHVERKTGMQLRLRLYPSIPDFEQGFLKGEPDFAYMNPYHAVMAHNAHGYLPIVRDSKRALTGILVVRKASPLQSLRDLAGEVIAFPAPNAFAAALYMRALLREKERLDFKPFFALTHANAYRHALRGKAAAAGGVKRTLSKEVPTVKDSLRVIYETPSTPSHPLCVHPRVPASVRQAVTEAILDLRGSEAGRKLLEAVLLPEPIRAEYARDYEPLKSLNLEKYLVFGAP